MKKIEGLFPLNVASGYESTSGGLFKKLCLNATWTLDYEDYRIRKEVWRTLYHKEGQLPRKHVGKKKRREWKANSIVRGGTKYRFLTGHK